MPSKLVFFATAWGTKHGGINSFNYDLCLSLSKLLHDRYEVLCVVPTASEKAVLECRKQGLHLISAKNSTEHEEFQAHSVIEIVAMLGQDTVKDVVWWIGHDVVTGPIALEARKTTGKGNCAVIHHMDYEAYKAYQETEIDKLWKNIDRQIEILSSADVVFGVGPKLTNSAKEKIRGKSEAPVHELIPGLPMIDGIDPPHKFSAMTYGRVDQRNDIIKQVNLAVAGFARTRASEPDPLGNDATMTIFGLSNQTASEERKKLLQIAEEQSRKAIHILSRPYLEDRQKLYDFLRRQSVCMMLSLHEGFGLAGWEAIGAEVPLIVSKNSGVFETVDNLLSGMGTGCLTAVEVRGSTGDPHFREEDVKNVAAAIASIKQKEAKAKQNAKILKNLLRTICTWNNTAVTLSKALGLKISVEAASINIDRWRPELLIKSISDSGDMVENIARRKQQFQLVWDRMKPPSGFSHLLIIFGGISSSLCDEGAAHKYSQWLTSNPSARLFICFESGPSAIARARKLDRQLLESESGLPTEAEERMREKERRVLALEEILESELGQANHSTLSRVHFLPLKEPLTTYIIITDDDVYMTPLLETRSSETLSFALARKPIQFRLDVFNFIIYHLEMLEHSEATTELIQELKHKINEDTNDTQEE